MDIKSHESIREDVDVALIQEMCEKRYRWFGNVLRKEHDSVACSVQNLTVNGKSKKQ